MPGMIGHRDDPSVLKRKLLGIGKVPRPPLIPLVAQLSADALQGACKVKVRNFA
jgi:hypothetical protein